SLPVRATNLSGVTKIATSGGANHTLALKSDGTVWGWGSSAFGEVGSGTNGMDTAVPMQIAGLTGVTALAAGTFCSFAVTSDGTAWGWGYNLDGELGNGTTPNPYVPAAASGQHIDLEVSAGS